MSDFADAESRAEWDAAFRKQAALFDTDDRKHYQRSTLELADPSANSVGASHFKDGDETEAAAARLVEPRTGTGRMRVLSAMAASGEPLTDYDIAQRTGMRLYTAAPRRGELLRGGWIEDSGARKPTDSGTNAIAWRLSERGRIEWNRMKGE